MSDTENIQNLINERNNQNKRIEQLVVEIEQLRTELNSKNNIINELEKHLNQEIIEWQDVNDLWTRAQVQEDRIVLNKLKELKDSD